MLTIYGIVRGRNLYTDLYIANIIVPVSYTHLDVYKRQEYNYTQETVSHFTLYMYIKKCFPVTVGINVTDKCSR